MKKWTTVIFIILIFVLQFSVLGVFIRSERIPNLFVAFVVCLIVLFGFEKSVPWIILAGLVMDSGASWLIGSGALVLILIAWLLDKLKVIAELRSKRYMFAFLLALLIMISAATFDLLMLPIVNFEKQLGIAGVGNLMLNINPDYGAKLIYSVFFGIVIYYFARRINIQQTGIVSMRK